MVNVRDDAEVADALNRHLRQATANESTFRIADNS
jgi:hypothetical protein